MNNMIGTKLVGIQGDLTLIKLANPKLPFPLFSFVASPLPDARKKYVLPYGAWSLKPIYKQSDA
jgi:hypothetical protein